MLWREATVRRQGESVLTSVVPGGWMWPPPYPWTLLSWKGMYSPSSDVTHFVDHVLSPARL